MPLEVHQTFLEDIDNIFIFNNTKPIVVDYRDRQHYYLFCTQNLDIDAGQYGTLHIQASVWNELPVEQGTKLLPVGINASSPQLFTVIARASNKTYAPIPPLQFDISNISQSQAAIIIGPIGIPFYKLVTVQLAGTWTGTILAEQSVNGTVYVPTVLVNLSDTTLTRAASMTANGLYRVPLIGRYFQLRASGLTSGTVTASTIFFMTPVDM